MNYVNKENAIGLKEIGFDVPCRDYYQKHSKTIYFGDLEKPNNKSNDCYSAPDFLSAADWFYDKHNIEIAFRKSVSFVFYNTAKDVFGKKDTFRESDHRNTALAAAIKRVKERQTKSAKKYDTDLKDYNESFECKECGNDDIALFKYDRTVANGEVWICQSCKAERLTPHEPKEENY